MLGDDSTSTPVPSALEEEREKTSDTGISENDEDKDVESPAHDASEYPQGTSLAFIVVALALSIFLASLDMVGVFSTVVQIV